MLTSAQSDRFCHERMPSAAALPQLVFDRPEFQFLQQMNAVVELLDKRVAAGEGARIMLRGDDDPIDEIS